MYTHLHLPGPLTWDLFPHPVCDRAEAAERLVSVLSCLCDVVYNPPCCPPASFLS